MRTAAAVTTCVFLVSCSLVSGLGDLTRSDDDVGGADAGADAPSAEANSPVDSGPRDSGPTPDAGDAGCPGFCDNFDDRTTVQGAWDNLNSLGAGDPSNASIASSVFLSAPHSLQFHIPAKPSGSVEGVTLGSEFPLVAGKIILDLDMKIVGNSPSESGYIGFVDFGLVNQYAGSVSANPFGVVIDYWVNFPDGGHVQPLASAALDESWHHAHYEAHYDPTSGSILAMWDGTSLIDVSNVVTDGVPPVPSTVGITIGYSVNASMPAMDVYFDNVQIH